MLANRQMMLADDDHGENFMRRSGRLFIVLGVVLALAALLLAIFALAGGDDGDDTTTEVDDLRPTDVVVVQARSDIPAHTVLKEGDLEEVTVKSDTVTGDEANDIGEVVGFAYSEELIEGQRILRSRLEISGIAEELEPGRRAISMPVDKNNMVAGLIRQDDSIDIIYEINAELLRVTPTTPLELQDSLELRTDVVIPPFGEDPDPAPYPYPGEPGSRFIVTDADFGNPVAKVVLQDIRILRVINAGAATPGGQQSQTDSSDYLVIEVDPTQAELIHMMLNVGTFQIMLRGPEDADVVTTPGLNLETLVTGYDLPIPKTIRLPAAGAQ
jgi:pilus assembly protein CpaB